MKPMHALHIQAYWYSVIATNCEKHTFITNVAFEERHQRGECRNPKCFITIPMQKTYKSATGPGPRTVQTHAWCAGNPIMIDFTTSSKLPITFYTIKITKQKTGLAQIRKKKCLLRSLSPNEATAVIISCTCGYASPIDFLFQGRSLDFSPPGPHAFGLFTGHNPLLRRFGSIRSHCFRASLAQVWWGFLVVEVLWVFKRSGRRYSCGSVFSKIFWNRLWQPIHP